MDDYFETAAESYGYVLRCKGCGETTDSDFCSDACAEWHAENVA